ncbi:hypothetical protein Taro_027599 [Colocasia esculenta]|uniref:DUF4219 domain-containing protein n=1 Tax=Colocasia esculenta TaxID=4460 RepID=A0A843VG52_COLES|nr:hypothetical protein [Colocasia esculenta]
MAAQGNFEGQSFNRPPLFDGEDYPYWKTRMEYFLQGHDYQIWSIVEEGDLFVTNEKAQWTDDDRKKISLNCKAKSILCCALSKKEFNRVSACKSSMEMWEKLRITYEGTDKVKETRIDILVTQYERFQMQSSESITQMFSRFTDITNGLASLGKVYEMGDMVRKILRSLPSSWTPKVTAIEEANDLKRMSVEKLIGSLMAHEINMERLGESSSRKKHSNALKAKEDSPKASSAESESNADSENEEAMLSRRLQRILAKKKKSQSGRKYFKRNKDFKKPDGKEIWDTKSKLNVSLPYAHLLTKIFKHFGVDLSGAVVEKMGQAIRSRNLKKSGFSMENGVWFKASVAEGEAIIIDTSVVHPEMGSANMAPELPVESILAPAVEAVESSGPSIAEVQSESVVEEERVFVEASGFPEEPVQTFTERRIEDLLPEDIIPVEDPHPSIVVASILADIIDSIPLISSAPESSSSVVKETVATGHIDDQMEDVLVEVEHQAAQGDSVLESAPSQGEQVSDEENAPIEGELSKEGPEDVIPDVNRVEEHRDFSILDDREGATASSSSSDDDLPPPENKSKKKGKEVASGVPLLADSPFQRQAKKKIVIQLKPVIERLNVQGELLCSLQSDVNSIFLSQASANKELAQIRNAMKWFNQEMSSMKGMLLDIIKAVEAHAPPPPEAAPGAATASEEVGPTGPADQDIEAEEILAPKPPAPSSPSHTPIPPTPPSAPTAPPAPQTFKKPQSRPISSPTPFQSTIPSPSPTFEAPPGSSAGASSASSSGPSLGPTDDLHTTSHSFLHPTPPPSFITIIPEHAQLSSPFIEKIKDKFEEGILRFLLREYHQGHVKAEVLSPILSECERLTSSDWSKFYPLSAQQLSTLNEAQAREGKPAISPATFLDMNSINLVHDPFKVWEERYKVYVALHQALQGTHNHYPVTIDQFLSCASFGTSRFLKMNMDNDAYADLLYKHLDLHLKRMAPTMGPSYSVSFVITKKGEIDDQSVPMQF